MQPLSQIHLNELDGGGVIQYIYIFAAIGFIVLMIALINFMNLATACSSNRAKEVGMRRIGGANRQALVVQFLKESVFMSFLALFLALIIVELTLPFFEEFAQFKIRLNWRNGFTLIPLLFIATLLTGLMAGSYPAFFLSSYDPLRVIKGILTRGKKGVCFRRIMVILQFISSILLIICTMVVYEQMELLKNRELGFNKDNMIYLIQRGELHEKFPKIGKLFEAKGG